MAHQFELLKDRRFGPLFLTMFMGAFNDNLFKTMLVVLIAYGVWDIGDLKPEVLVSLSAALFILPFILVAPLGGSLADKFDKALIMRWLKIVEIGIVCAVILGIWLQSVPFLLFVLFIFGVHSALFSPPKYSIVPQHLNRDELIGANALLNTGSFISILLGNVLGSLWGISHEGHMSAFAVLLACALIGFAASRKIPPAPSSDPNLKLHRTLFSDIGLNFVFAFRQPKGTMVSLLGIAWFYFVGGSFLAQFPNFAKQSLHVDNLTLSVFMTMFTVGIAVGGLLNNALLKSHLSARYVGAGALGIAVFCCDLYFASQPFATQADMTLSIFMQQFAAWRILFDIFMVSVFAGIYVVPLNAILQAITQEAYRARVVSVSNVLDAVFILGASILGIVLFSAGFKVEHLFLLQGILTFPVAAYFFRKSSDFGDVTP